MQANLLLFYDENNSNKFCNEIAPDIIQNFGLAMQNITCVTSLPTYTSIKNIISNLTDNTIIAVGFCDSFCLQNIKNAIAQFYSSTPFQTNFGFFVKSNNKQCSIINTDKYNKDNFSSLPVLCEVDNIFYLKLFGINEIEMLKSLYSIADICNYEIANSIRVGEIQLCFRPINSLGKSNLENFKRELFQKFDKFIYSDEPKTLAECVKELTEVRKMRFAVIDLVLDSEIDIKSNFKINITQEDVERLLSTTNGTEYIFQKYDIDFISLATGNLDNPQILAIDSLGIRKFQYKISGDLEYKKRYLYNLVLSKIFAKLRKNSLFF